MRSPACVRAALLLDRRAAGLGEAERLQLEEHVAACAECQADAALLGAVVERLREAAPAARTGVPARERAIARALAAAGTPDVAPERPWLSRRTSWAVAGLVAASLAAVSVAVVGLVTSVPDDPTAAGTPAAGTAAAATAVPAGTTVVLGRAKVALAPEGSARWEPARETLVLEAGRAHVEVTPAAGAPTFRVATPRFVVEVVGTEFDVDAGMPAGADAAAGAKSPAGSVSVVHGVVRVVSATDGTLLAQLGAGATWNAADGAAPAGAEAWTPAAYLAEARRALAARDVERARALVALAGPISRTDVAEARSLLAECALVAGDGATAARLYAAVAAEFRELPAAETALFAAARLEMDAGRADGARALLREYAERYPAGRFHAEVERRLARLGKR